jgi:hypothetical protein
MELQVQGLVKLQQGDATISLAPVIQSAAPKTAPPTPNPEMVAPWGIHPSRKPITRETLTQAIVLVQKQLQLPTGIRTGGTVNEDGSPDRCNAKKCQCFVTPQHLHPLFTTTRGGEGHSLQVQSMALLLMLSNVPFSTIHTLTQINHKAIERMWRSLALLQKKFVEAKEKHIQFGTGGRWQDIEADEATFDKLLSSSLVHWEQWAGLVARGRPESLVLIRLQPPSTTVRAPGPGAIPKVEWKPIADKWLKDRHVILHTDSARSYKAKVRGVLHDSVVHQKNPAKVKGKWVWRSPNFAKLKTHKLPSGKTIRLKAGTQIIHRAWRFIKDRPRWVAPSSVLISDLRSMSTGIAVKICGHAPGSFCLPTCKTSLLRCSNLLWPWGKCAARLCLTIAVFLSHLQ